MKFLNKIPKTILSVFLLLCLTVVFFIPLFFQNKYPIPADTVVGLYHPWRDNVWNGFTQGVPYKNFLITDPVRQQYPWRNLSIDLLKENKLPLWNPYTLSGTPLSSNFQSAPYYPLNILFLFFSFPLAWSLLVFLQPVLSSLFMFFYLRNLNISKAGSSIGAIVLAFCGFSIAWMTWNTIIHTLLWLPLILLSIDKIIRGGKKWCFVLFFSFSSSLLAGHLQVFFYVFCLSFVYIVSRIIYINVNKLKTLALLFLSLSLSFLATSPFWVPTFQFILLSSRSMQANYWERAEWFIPWQQLIQFVVPDFFGNPATLNYWGVWNYGEFIGFVGVAPLMLAVCSLLFRRDKKTLFYGLVLLITLIFTLPTFLAKLPFVLKLPFISTSQPTRLLSIADYSLSVLAALGFDSMRKFSLNRKQYLRQFSFIAVIFLLLYVSLWWFIHLKLQLQSTEFVQFLTAQRNLYFPTVIAVASLFFIALRLWKPSKNLYLKDIALSSFLIVIIIIDLFRFGWKFIPFTNPEYLFPKTKITFFLQSQNQPFRFMSLDSRIFPPNFSVVYRLQTVEGYDPVYTNRYGEYLGMWIRGKPDISPYDFNRILTPQNIESRLADLANVRYVLSLRDEQSAKLQFVVQEGETRLYENKDTYPRIFLAEKIISAKSKQEAANLLMDKSVDLRKTAILEEIITIPETELQDGEKAEIVLYSENIIKIRVQSIVSRILILTDTYYPTWNVYIDGKRGKIYRTDYTFRGVIVPPGEHIIEFKIHAF